LELLALTKGLDQSCLLLGIAFQFYNLGLVDICDTRNGKEAITFMYDTLLLPRGKMLADTNSQIKQMMTRKGGRLEWSNTHQCKFTVNKLSIMGLTRRRELDHSGNMKTRPIQRWPIFLQGIKVPAVTTHKFLGVLMDQELWWKEHLHYMLQKGMKWVTQYCRLSKPSKGISPKYMRVLFISIAVPKMMYATDLFLTPGSQKTKGMKGAIKKLTKIPRQATLHITRALRSAPTDMVDACTDILPFHLLVKKLTCRAASRLATLPQSHPFEKHITQASARYVKNHRALLHEVQHPPCL